MAAAVCHGIVRSRLVARDPLALGLLVFAGLTTTPIWPFGIGINLNAALALPLRLYLALSLVILVFQQLWALVVATASAGVLSSRSGSGPPLPALPIGPRARVAAEALVGMAFVLAVRVGAALLADLWWPRLFEGIVTVRNTLLGALFTFPLVLAWTAVRRFDVRGLYKPALVSVLVVAAASFDVMRHVGAALAVSALLSILVLVRLDDGSRSEVATRPATLRFRTSPGPLRQLRRDALLGPVRERWVYLLLVVPLPFVLAALTSQMTLVLIVFTQVLALAALPFLPFGLRLVPSAAGGYALFGGHFGRAWSTLPVPRERVARAVYAHGLLAAALVWLVLGAHTWLQGARSGPLLLFFELPAVFLAAGIVVCEAVGDRGRGVLALVCLIGYQFVLPLGYVAVFAALGAASAGAGFALHGDELTITAYVLGLIGGVPPLVHLRAARTA